jgi:hypothetical protein
MINSHQIKTKGPMKKCDEKMRFVQMSRSPPDAVVAAGAADVSAGAAVVALAVVQVGEVGQLIVVDVCDYGGSKLIC